MRFSYDREVDILMIYLVENGDDRRTHGRDLTDAKGYVDLAEDGTILALEIQNASQKYALADLQKYPARYDQPISLAQAAYPTGLSQQALRKACERGRLRAQKIGHVWTTTVTDVHEYLASRHNEGPGSASKSDEGVGVGSLRKPAAATERKKLKTPAERSATTTRSRSPD